jgi:N-acetylglutamate synthase-like GNAT family acetyltransferase
MSTSQPQARRATIDDLPKLTPLWRAEGLAAHDLEKRFKEFQLIEGPDGEVLGTIGLQISGHEGRLHSETFAHPEDGDSLRQQLWERVQMIANNHGIIRLWTQLESPFWHHVGFTGASGGLMVRLPSVFAGDQRRPWLFYQLRSETAAVVSLDKEFAMFREAERERTEKIFRQARVLKMIAAVLAVAVLGLVIFWAISFFQLNRRRR